MPITTLMTVRTRILRIQNGMFVVDFSNQAFFMYNLDVSVQNVSQARQEIISAAIKCGQTDIDTSKPAILTLERMRTNVNMIQEADMPPCTRITGHSMISDQVLVATGRNLGAVLNFLCRAPTQYVLGVTFDVLQQAQPLNLLEPARGLFGNSNTSATPSRKATRPDIQRPQAGDTNNPAPNNQISGVPYDPSVWEQQPFQQALDAPSQSGSTSSSYADKNALSEDDQAQLSPPNKKRRHDAAFSPSGHPRTELTPSPTTRYLQPQASRVNNTRSAMRPSQLASPFPYNKRHLATNYAHHNHNQGILNVNDSSIDLGNGLSNHASMNAVVIDMPNFHLSVPYPNQPSLATAPRPQFAPLQAQYQNLTQQHQESLEQVDYMPFPHDDSVGGGDVGQIAFPTDAELNRELEGLLGLEGSGGEGRLDGGEGRDDGAWQDGQLEDGRKVEGEEVDGMNEEEAERKGRERAGK